MFSLASCTDFVLFFTLARANTFDKISNLCTLNLAYNWVLVYNWRWGPNRVSVSPTHPTLLARVQVCRWLDETSTPSAPLHVHHLLSLRSCRSAKGIYNSPSDRAPQQTKLIHLLLLNNSTMLPPPPPPPPFFYNFWLSSLQSSLFYFFFFHKISPTYLKVVY